MSKEKSVTSFKNIDKEKYSTVGVVVVLAHQSPSGVEVLLFDHKKSDKTEEGMLGLPSETIRWNRRERKTEAIKDTITRCFYEEMDYQIQKHQFFTNPGKVYTEMPFYIQKGGLSQTALGRIVVMWTDSVDFVPEKIDTPEVKGANFYNVEDILENKDEMFLRDNTYNIVKTLSQKSYFDLSSPTRSVNSFENRGLVPVDLTPDVIIKK
jgi:hypothetical protein